MSRKCGLSNTTIASVWTGFFFVIKEIDRCCISWKKRLVWAELVLCEDHLLDPVESRYRTHRSCIQSIIWLSMRDHVLLYISSSDERLQLERVSIDRNSIISRT